MSVHGKMICYNGFIVNANGEAHIKLENSPPFLLKEKLADLLTLSRGIIALVILSLSFIGKEAYLAVVILVLVGVVTDILDGKAARRYLGKGRESRLGKFDLEVDTLFVLCTMAYLSFSGIVIPRVFGLAWIGLAVITVLLCRRKTKILLIFEVPMVIALLVISGIYSLKIFAFIILPAMLIGLIINRKRVLYIIFEYWPKVFSE